jgi:ATP-dependent helicase/nuclease subunit A
MGKIAELFCDDSRTLLGDVELVYPAVRALLDLTADFSDAYAAEKGRRGLLDFSDLEHFTLRLLLGGDGAPTDLAGEWSGRFAEIMVDEYQDTNEVQNAIFTVLSRAGRNLFLVGDVKQSIYRFRLADPTIFLEKYRTFKYYTEAAEGEERYITLSRNFRSRLEVLESVNDLFSDLMSEEFGEMDYTAKEALYPGGSFPDSGDYRTELDVLDCGDREEGELGKTDKNLMEARFTARRIRELSSGGLLISDGEGGVRPARPEDVVILLRSPGPVLHHYARALGEQGLSWSAEGAEDFFASTEVNVALSILQIVDNPRQDVALISALRSPVWGFSGDRLAQLRTCSGGDFYDALLAAAQEEEGEDCRAFLAELGRLRLGAGDFSSHRLLWEIYERTNLPGIFGAMPDGQERQGNLLTLYELARRFEESGHRGLFGFLAHVSRLRDAGVRIVPPQTPGEGGGVSVLSIHRSKGLEFPVVFVCGLARRFNRDDLKKTVLFHPRLGVGPKALDRERMIEYATLPRLAVASKLEYEMMAEELRLLYVAMTRAKEKLIMTYVLSTGARELGTLSEDAGSPVEPQALLSCSCVGQWVLLSALSRPEAGALREAAGVFGGESESGSHTSEWDIRLTDGATYETAPKKPERTEEGPEEDAPEDGELIRRLTWVNPNKALEDVPSKLTATQLKGRFMDEEAAQEADMPGPRPPMRFHRPRFAAEELGLTAAQKGTALHLALQYMDFAKTSSAAEIDEEIGRLTAKALLTDSQAEAIDVEKLFSFFASPFGREVLNARGLRREFKFSILVPAADYYPGAGTGECILLQGVIDCWFEQGDGLTVLDFKTDRVTEETVAQRAEEYRPQLAAYGRALEEITGQKVGRRILWFFALNRAVEL